ncbi:hypothetical protein BD324DRAFT_613633 [Kockovaella imperatae]|uniref:Uncharacterized protein n=1 Tax=Kockovaella imperatae TaxID=4999 RepID=A0A1Y1UUR0_9TREE|nr:hypothetical protein BD324DRAFT_613633 [Kockovaella imperatae]ORX41206.1 hypothetical protein BD324DRAFT_613633 [Kockovaella imperatae]
MLKTRGDSADSDDDATNELDISYEQERMENIQNNAALLSSLGLSSELSIRPHKPSSLKSGKPKRTISSAEERTRRQVRAREAALKRDLEPTRRSSRVAGKPAPDYLGEGVQPPSPTLGPTSNFTRPDPLPRQTARVIPSGPQYDSGEIFEPAPLPSRREDGVLIFEGRWKDVFTPNVSPEEMFLGGAFAGGFFADTYSHVLKSSLSSSQDIADLPFSAPSSSVLSERFTNPEPDGDVNRFKVRAGQSLQEWEKAGWIWPADPRGWAQWYLRFWSGRRCEDDERQVRRWLKVAGPTGRFKRALMKKVHAAGGVPGGGLADEDVGRVLRQCLWQWGYELTESEYTRAMETGA